jgi:hypothetical protein
VVAAEGGDTADLTAPCVLLQELGGAGSCEQGGQAMA